MLFFSCCSLPISSFPFLHVFSSMKFLQGKSRFFRNWRVTSSGQNQLSEVFSMFAHLKFKGIPHFGKHRQNVTTILFPWRAANSTMIEPVSPGTAFGEFRCSSIALLEP